MSFDKQGYWLFNTWNRKLKFFNIQEYTDYKNNVIDNKKVDILTRDLFLIDAQTNIYQWSKDLYYEKCLSDKTLSVTIMPTMACNFRCFYCYENHDAIRMTGKMQDLVIAAIIDRMKEYDSLRVEWFGGEPLLEIETIVDISSKLIDYCKESGKSYIASMTTNGYLLTYDNYCLLKTKCRVMYYQVSIDGNKNDHDQSRPLSNGGGTFDKIISNLKDIKANEKSSLVKICIRTNYTASNIIHRKDWERYLHNEFLDDRRFTYIPKIAWNNYRNEENNYKYLSLSFGSSLTNLNDPTNLQNDFLKAFMDLNTVSKGEICYASKPNSIIIGPEGKLMKCTVHLDSDINNVGYIDANGKFVINSFEKSYWVKETVDDTCLSCPIFPICLAGCGCRYKHRNNSMCEKETKTLVRLLEELPYNEVFVHNIWT